MDGMPNITGGAATSGATNGNFQVGNFGGSFGFPPPPSSGFNDVLPFIAIAGLAWLILKKK
jgi:hypothetical protein